MSLNELHGAVSPFYDQPNTNSKAIAALSRATAHSLNRLTARQREALEMYYLEGYTQRRIAELWGIDKSAVSRHLARARRRVSELVVTNTTSSSC